MRTNFELFTILTLLALPEIVIGDLLCTFLSCIAMHVTRALRFVLNFTSYAVRCVALARGAAFGADVPLLLI